MTNARVVLHAWANLPPEVRDLGVPVPLLGADRGALATFEAVWNEVGGQKGHPLGSLFELLRDRITTGSGGAPPGQWTYQPTFSPKRSRTTWANSFP